LAVCWAGARLRDAGYTAIRIIDEGGDFGGTWYWNRYPGLMCDIEAHIYLPLLEETHYAPRHRYAYGPEIFEHCQRIGRAVRPLRQSVLPNLDPAMHWQEDTQRWLVETDRGDRMTADFVVLAAGRQSLPKLPSIPGSMFSRVMPFHSSRWDYSYTKGDQQWRAHWVDRQTGGRRGNGRDRDSDCSCSRKLGQGALCSSSGLHRPLGNVIIVKPALIGPI